MNELAALLRAVCHKPNDDAPRLIVADWFDEHGQPERATIIHRMIAAPTYVVYWTSKAKRPRHVHAEPIEAIRGLNGIVTTCLQREFAPSPDLKAATIRRGFAEAITMPAEPFIQTAGQIFATNPVLEVEIPDLHAAQGFEYPQCEVFLCDAGFMYGRWPNVLFDERPRNYVLRYPSLQASRTDLSRHAAAYGRRQAGIRREPPPVPIVRQETEVRMIDTGTVAEMESIGPALRYAMGIGNG